MSMTSKIDFQAYTILIVDDNFTNLGMIADYLKDYGFRVVVSQDGDSGFDRAKFVRPDLILLDVMMPGTDGFETCRRLKDSPETKDIPVIFMTALTNVMDKVKGFEVGGVDYVTKPIQHEEVLARVTTHLNIRDLTQRLQEQNERLQKMTVKLEDANVEIVRFNQELENKVRARTLELQEAYDITIAGWARALELRDQETEGHSQRVAEMTVHLAQIMGFSQEELEHIRRGALLHDIGKMGIPDTILLKVGPLTDEEQAVMQKHPHYAYELLKNIAFLHPALDIPRYHHERWDGSGYCEGLKGEQIPLAARIFAVVDVWDALTSDRPYRQAWPKEKVRIYIVEQSGKHFDPAVVEHFFRYSVHPNF